MRARAAAARLPTRRLVALFPQDGSRRLVGVGSRQDLLAAYERALTSEGH